MDDPVDNSLLRLAAFHEAGHVIMRHHHGLVTPSVVIWPDGTGMTAPGPGIIESLEVHLDVLLGGLAAEETAGGPVSTPTGELVEALMSDIDGVDAEDSWDDFYHAAVVARTKRPAWTDEELTAAFAESYDRCLETLRKRWEVSGRLADALVASLGSGLAREEIENILG